MMIEERELTGGLRASFEDDQICIRDADGSIVRIGPDGWNDLIGWFNAEVIAPNPFDGSRSRLVYEKVQLS